MDTCVVYFLPYPDLEDQLVFMSDGLHTSPGTVEKTLLIMNTSLALTTEF